MKNNIIIFVNAIRPETFVALDDYYSLTGKRYIPIVLVDKNIKDKISARNGQLNITHKVQTLCADFDSADSISQIMKPYINHIYTIVCQYENSILELKKLIPYFPYLNLSSESSLDWSTEKEHMRNLLETYDPTLVPRHLSIKDNSATTINLIL